MNETSRPSPVETPRVEPEILPPGSGGPFGSGGVRWTSWESGGERAIFIRRVGPFQLFVWSLLAILVVAGFFFLFAGALLIAIPVAAALVGGSIVAAWLRRTFRR